MLRILKFLSILYIRNLLGLLLPIVCFVTANGQAPLRLLPLEQNEQLVTRSLDDPNRSVINCQSDTLLLPFFEDFSRVSSFYPSCDRWTDQDVFVNNSMYDYAPSVGVATFDGLNENGYPYNQFANPASGLGADTLTSQSIDLGGFNPIDSVILSFYLQKQGLGDRPELQDSFFVDFWDDSGRWVNVFSIGGVDNSFSVNEIPNFEQFFIPVTADSFLHPGFSFRFRNYASLNGNNDHYHLDFIYMDVGRTNTDSFSINYGRYADISYSRPLSTPLKNGLYAMPWRHFSYQTCMADSITFQMFNHNPCNSAGTLDRIYSLEHIGSSTIPLLNQPIATQPNYSCSPSNDDQSRVALDTFSFNQTIQDSFKIRSSTAILFPFDFQSNPLFEVNDTTYLTNTLRNYYAYDDGTAESRIIAQGLGTTIAVEYTSEIDDTLRGIFFHLPYYTNNNSNNDLINVKVWLDSLDNEVFSRDFYKLVYIYGFNGFHYVTLQDFTGQEQAIPIKAGQTFYVGWQQASQQAVPVGFDRTSNAMDKTFYSTGGSWQPSPFNGSIMIRPLFSPDSSYFVSNQIVPTEEWDLKIYPNPANSLIHLDIINEGTSSFNVDIYSSLGQHMFYSDRSTTLTIKDWPSGIYVARLRTNNQQVFVTKHFIKW